MTQGRAAKQLPVLIQPFPAHNCLRRATRFEIENGNVDERYRAMKRIPVYTLLAMMAVLPAALAQDSLAVDTNQVLCYDESGEITCPGEGQAFYGQDSQYDGNQPLYSVSGDGLTVHDIVTGLTWQQSPDTDGNGVIEYEDKLSFQDALDRPAALNAMNYGGFNDWRLPSIKELYSLIDFSGVDPSGWTGGTAGLIPFIDTDTFGFEYGDESAGERIIDSQYWSSNEYVGLTMTGDHTVFGVNFADGRIKGYGTTLFGNDKLSFVQCVRGNAGYGTNDFTDNGDGTVTDNATGLMWMQGDSGSGMFWEDALTHAEDLVFAGHDDWRLPNVKELQIILDYTRAPNAVDPGSRGPAIDPIFSCTGITDEGGGTNYPFYWASTTHSNWTENPGRFGAYVCFGEALGWMEFPPDSGNWNLLDVHGAGSQRSDPKTGDPADWPHGNGPQGDVVRIYNHVRCVRDEVELTGEFVITGPGPGYDNHPLVRAFPAEQDANHSSQFPAYGPEHYGVNVTTGDVDGDALDEILTGAGPGDIYGPHVRGFDISGSAISGLSFLAYGTNKFGVNVAAGDIDGDGYAELVTGAGPGAVFGPHVRGWDFDGGPEVSPVAGVSYFAYGTPKWGVNVACGDIDGDGNDEIVTGAGPGAVYGPHVRGWNVDGGPAAAISAVSFLAYGTNKFGVNVTCGDVDGDGIDEIVTGAGPGVVFSSHVRGWNYDGAALTPISAISFFAWPSDDARYGVNVYAGTDLDDDGRDELVVGPGPDPNMSSLVKVYQYDGSQVSLWLSFQAYPDGWMKGASVAAGNF